MDMLRLDFWPETRASRLGPIYHFKKKLPKKFFFRNFCLFHRFRPKFTALALLRISGEKGAIFYSHSGYIIFVRFRTLCVAAQGVGLIPALDQSKTGLIWNK